MWFLPSGTRMRMGGILEGLDGPVVQQMKMSSSRARSLCLRSAIA